MAKTKPPKKKEKTPPRNITGTYKYDPKLGRVVKVSDRVPKVSSQSKKNLPCGPAEPSSGQLPCGQGSCGGGSCGMDGFGGLG